MTTLLARFLACAAALALPLQASAAPFLWEVASMTNRVYLYGTVHAGKLDWYPLPAAVEQALEDSQALVVEADITDTEGLRRAQPVALVPPDTLAKHVDPPDYDRFRKLLPRYSLPESQVAQLKPFMAVSLLVFAEWARQGFVPQYGVDAYLIKKARDANKPVREIEGLEVQVDLIDSISDEENKLIFTSTLGALEEGLTGEQINGMVNAWREGDPRAMLEVAQRYNEKVAGARALEEKFVWARHEPMLRKIESYLNDSKERQFIAVGALHLAGPRGLVEILRKRGYIVSQVGR